MAKALVDISIMVLRVGPLSLLLLAVSIDVVSIGVVAYIAYLEGRKVVTLWTYKYHNPT